MPELPDIEAYVVALERVIGSRELQDVSLHHPFLLRSVGTPPESAIGRSVAGVSRLGKRIVIAFEGGPWYVIHLMVAGRLLWKEGTRSSPRVSGGSDARASEAARARRPSPKRGVLARFLFASGELALRESGSRRMASLHVVAERDALDALDPGGSELLDGSTSAEAFAGHLRRENHTIKRSLTDPRLFSGIGNAYSDEILFAARISPFAMTQSMGDDEIGRLFEAAVSTLTEWRDRFVAEAAERFPTKVTAFRPEMHVHGRYNEPCTVCGTPVQRIRYAENECNYCPTCQSGGKVFADRALSRLLKGDWPRTVEELEKLGRPPTSR